MEPIVEMQTWEMIMCFLVVSLLDNMVVYLAMRYRYKVREIGQGYYQI